MPKGDKCIGLTNYLKGNMVISITMSFGEIEKQVGDTLPDSAYKYREFWSNTRTHSVAFGWLEAGYKTIAVDFKNQQVTFERV
ncbi:hypothetical protein KPL47_00765 [Clostridium estertheticum]|uniref:DUF7662 domain-containing protein n=1 Tax=Clostridium estertheticum TaxID=238834 RepID=UPI001C0B168D|nr:hypothetical protein [Clostridium estertheticum]MBU3174893.1 hypothetical protein [Clostridium estertheticum]